MKWFKSLQISELFFSVGALAEKYCWENKITSIKRRNKNQQMVLGRLQNYGKMEKWNE